MHALKGRKQSPEHIEKRAAAHRGKKRKEGAGGGRPKNTAEVLWSKVSKREPEECWPWLGFRNKQGYGRTWINDKGYYAHRVIFDLAKPGVIKLSAPKPGGYGFLLHSCDNPPCCNPVHLRVGNTLDNSADMKAKGRQPKYPGCTGPRCKLNEDDIGDIRMFKAGGVTLRAIALLYDVNRSTINHLVYGRTYKGVG